MIRKRLAKNADRSFRLIAALLMRRAIKRLSCIDEHGLSDAGLSRAAVARFMATPLRTDPHRFFRQWPTQPTSEFGAADADRRRPALVQMLRRTMYLRIRILAAGAVVAIGILSGCSGTAPEPIAIQSGRDPQPGRCRARPGGLPLLQDTRTGLQIAEGDEMTVARPSGSPPYARASPVG